MKLKRLAALDRPREKLFRYGPSRLSLQELLAILIDTGTSGKDVLSLARDVERVLKKEMEPSIKTLMEIKGLGLAKASRIMAAIELGRRLEESHNVKLLSPEIVWHSCSDITGSKKEQFVVFYLDAQYRQLKKELISVGSLTESLVHPREVFEPAVRLSCAAIILAHNHPSGSLIPSQEDMSLTKRLVDAGRLLGIEVLDHIIVSKDGFFSMKQESML